MKKKSYFWLVYRQLPRKGVGVLTKKEFLREHFWGWMFYHMPRLYKWCDKYLPFDTLPF